MFPSVYWLQKYTPPLARWGVALGSVVLFLGHEDIPGILLESSYGEVTTWKDVGVRFGLIQPPPAQE